MLLQTISCTLIFVVAVFLAAPLGRYLSRIYKEESSLLDFLQPLENRLFRFCRINVQAGMNWKQYLSAIFIINGIWFAWAMLILLFQGKFLLNPAHNPSMDWSLALNSAISFLTSTNLQHYAGESGATYLSQMTVFMFLQFVSAATSLAAGIAVARGLGAGTTSDLGNFYKDFVRSLTRVLLPLSLIVAIVFAFNGMPMTFRGPEKIYPVQGDSVQVATGPVAAMIPIKELGSNGGGFFAANDAHPFENPNFVTFAIHIIIVLLLPIAFVFCVGQYLQSKRFSRMLLVAMTAGFLLVTIPIVVQEMKGNPALAAMGLNTREGNMEGKELRFGSFYSAFYSGVNMVVPAGTLVGSHDSYMPLGGVTMLAGMHIDAFYGGLGTGWINIFLYLIIAVFIATLMIGRTPELLGRKIELREMQVASLVSVGQMLFPAMFTAIACFVYMHFPGGNEALQWLTNKGAHGFTTFLYEFVSSMAGNGSEFSGLGNNTVFWNLTTSVVMLCGRFLPIAGALVIAGGLREKKATPSTSGSLSVNSMTFGVFLFIVIIFLNALSFLPAFMLGPLTEHLSLH
ncbi:MAG TPA: potassium-transporting ATPase subunit KdpA [Puia sp.]|jgi:K+-transporting ATPase ATPase A chain|nr:potassium-transporting ATPase subunit KdpA [Puia sp.]